MVHGAAGACTHATSQNAARTPPFFLTRAVRMKAGRFTGLTKNRPVRPVFTGPIA
jgi:hypothetical protein